MSSVIQEADDASYLLNHPTLIKVLNHMRSDCYKRIESTNPQQRAEREESYLMLRTIKAFENQLKNRITNGKKAVNADIQQEIQNQLASLNM